MLPLFASGVFIAGLIWLEKRLKPEKWMDRKEAENFRKEREHGVDETVFWNLRH